MRLFALALVFAASSAHADAVRTLERAVAYAGRSKSNKTLYIPTPKGGISLRADGGDGNAGVIGVERTFSQTGFFLGRDGKLSPHDRQRLATTLDREHITRENVVRGLRRSMLTRRSSEQKLSAMDGRIDALLSDAKSMTGPKSYGAHLSIEPHGAGGAMIVVSKGFSQHAIFLDGSKTTGFSMSPSDRADVARVLLK